MKVKHGLLVGALLLTTFLSGCGMDKKADTIEDGWETIEEENLQISASQDKTDEKEDKKDIQDKKDSSIEEAQSESEHADLADENIRKEALLEYQKILEAAPAIDLTQEVLMDISFDYDESMEMFGNHYEFFEINDVNQDGIPELVTLSMINSRWSVLSIFTFADGNAVVLKNPMDIEGPGTFNQASVANGAYLAYICEDNHIHNVWRGTNPVGEEVEENSAFILDGTYLIETECSVGESENTVYFFDTENENIPENVATIIQ